MKELRRPSLMILRSLFLHGVKQNQLFLFLFVSLFACLFSSGFFFTNIMIQRASGEGGGYFYNSSLPLRPALQTLRHQPGYCCRDLTSAHSWQPDSNQKPLVSYRRSLSTKLSYPLKFAPSTVAVIADVVRSMLKIQVTLGDVSIVLLNLVERFIFVVFKLLPPMFTQLSFIFSLQFTNYSCFLP